MKNAHLVCLSAALLAACNDEVNVRIVSGDDQERTAAFAVHLSDYESAGVALLDAEGKVLNKKFISSGSDVAGLSAALAGDIALPTTPCDPERLTLVARKGGDYLLQVDLESGEVVHQIKTQTDTSDGAYESNPYDILCLGDGRALVSRWEPNLTPEPPELDRGDDLLLVDLEEETLEQRLELGAFQTEATTVNGEEMLYARPSSIVRLGDYALVGLSRVSGTFVSDEKGELALVRLSDFEVSKVELPELSNCGSLVPVAGRADAVLVSCAGAQYGAAETAGLAIVAVKDGKGEVETVFQAGEGLPALFSGAVSLGGTRVLAIAQDYVANVADEAYDVDLASGEATAVFEAQAPGDLGSGWYAQDKQLLLVPDINVGVRRFEVSEDGIDELEPAELSVTLPARTVRPLR